MTEPSKDDIADTLSATYRALREHTDTITDLREEVTYYTGSIILLANLLVSLLALTLGYYLGKRLLLR